MNENINETREIDFFDMIKALLQKWKLILCITLAALIAGGSFGLVTAIISNDYYGSTVEFYIYSEEYNDYILSLIKSDKFAESLLLDEYGLPEEYKDTQEYKDLLVTKIEIEELREEIKKIRRENELQDYGLKVSRLEKIYNDASADYNEIYNMLSTYKTAQDVTDVENHNAQLKSLEKKLEEKREIRDEAKAIYDEAALEKQEAEKKLEYAKRDLKNLRKDIEEPLEELLSKFRSQEENLNNIKKIKKYVTYEYEAKPISTSSTTKDETKSISSEALLRVEIAIPKDSEFAQFLVKAMTTKLPEFVEEEALFHIDSSQTPICEFISTFSTAEKIDGDSLIVTPIMYGGVAAVAALFVTCIVIILACAAKAKKEPEEIAETTSEEAKQ